MEFSLRPTAGILLIGSSLGGLWMGVEHLRDQEYVAAVIVVTTALSVLRAGVELLRPTVGE